MKHYQNFLDIKNDNTFHSVDHASFVDNPSPDDPASPLYTRFDILEEVRT